MSKRADVLEYTVLGALAEGPLHGYELRKRLTAILGHLRALSYGSLYPCLRRLQMRGWVTATEVASTSARRKVSYTLTDAGREAFNAWVGSVGPEAWEDEAFAARMAFFSRTEARVRLRILEGRRARLEERLAELEGSINRTRERVDDYALTLQEHGVEGARREVSWLDGLIAREQGESQATISIPNDTTLREQHA